MAIRPIDDLRCAYYLSLFVADRPGVLAAIAGALGRHNVSVRSMEQDAPEPEAGRPTWLRTGVARTPRRTSCSLPTLPSSGTCRRASTNCAASTRSGGSAGCSGWSALERTSLAGGDRGVPRAPPGEQLHPGC